MSDIKDFQIDDGVLKYWYRDKDTDVVIPDCVTSIGEYAFLKREDLTSITIPNSVTSIGKRAFEGCTSLTSVTIPDSVTRIENDAFNGCKSLIDVTIPDSVTNIGSRVFNGTPWFEKQRGKNPFVIVNGVLVKYSGKKTSVIIPDSVTVIGERSFLQKGLIESVIIPDTVTEIGKGAFRGCEALKKVKFSKNLKVIGESAFRNCTSLENVELCEDVKIEKDAFDGCDKLLRKGCLIINGVLISCWNHNRTKFVVPGDVKRIISLGYFYVNSLTIPDTVEEIDNGAFSGLQYLGNFTFRYKTCDAKEAQRLVKKVFWWEPLARLYLEDALKGEVLFINAVKNQIDSAPCRRKIWTWRIYDDSLKMSRFLECCKKVPLEELDKAIEKTKDLSVRAILIDYKKSHYSVQDVEDNESNRIDIELGIKEKSLADWRKEFKIVKKNNRYVITGYKEEAAKEQFRANKDYYNVVVIPAKICGLGVDMGDRVFQDCEYVNEVIVEEGVEEIGAYAFADCRRLSAVHLPSSVKRFGSSLFPDAAFYTIKYKYTVYAPADSAAYREAKSEGVKVVEED